MKSIDVVIISDAKNDYLKSLTEQAIGTAIINSGRVFVKVIVVEKQDVTYDGCVMVKQEGLFNYNKYLNIGASHGKADYIAFCNNDLSFGENWAENIISEMTKENCNSASPFCLTSSMVDGRNIQYNSGNYFGYKVRENFTGWCFVWSRELFDRIGGIGTNMSFWCSDDETVVSLKENNEKHFLCTSSIVTHLENGSKTLFQLPPDKVHDLTHGEVKRYNRIFKTNLFGLGNGVTNDVTVIIPVFGDIEKWKPYFERANKSALNQTVKSKYVVISMADNLQEARNRVGLTATTEYILFCDSDDELDEKYIESMLKGSGDIRVPSVHRYYEDGRIDKDQYWYMPVDLLERNYCVIGSLIRTDLFKKIGGFEDLANLEDWNFFLHAEESGATFEQIPEAIYKIHVREGSRNSSQELAEQIRNEAKKRRGLL